jgi:hypothetical protein
MYHTAKLFFLPNCEEIEGMVTVNENIPRRSCYWLLLGADNLEIKLQPSDLPVSLTGASFTSLLYPPDVAPLLLSVMPDNPDSSFAKSLGGKKVRYCPSFLIIKMSCS